MAKVMRRVQPILGTFVEVGSFSDTKEILFESTHIFEVIRKIDSLLSFHNSESDLSRLNNSQGEFVELDPISVKVLRLAKAVSVASGGLFNPTVGGRLQSRGSLPVNRVSQTMLVGDASDIEICGYAVRLKRPVQVTLDGIAKGFAVDLGLSKMKQLGWPSGWINAGGDIKVYGSEPLQIFIRDQHNNVTGHVSIRNAAIATSHGGPWSKRNNADIISGKDGLANPGTWSVLARSAWRADALTKVACLSHASVRDRLLKRLGGVCLCKGAAS